LDLDSTQVPLVRSVWLTWVVGQSLAREAREELGLVQETLHIFKQVPWEVLLLLLFGLDVVVEEADFELIRQLLVQGKVDKVAVLSGHDLLSRVVGLCQIEHEER